MSDLPQKGYTALRRGRHSQAFTNYFVTICLEAGKTGLDTPEIFDEALKILEASSDAQETTLHALVLMPDHLHLLFELGPAGDLQRWVGQFKGRMSPILRAHKLRWQKGAFHDRRLRETDPVGTVVRYIWMNPYRKKLLSPDKTWPYFFASKKAMTWAQSDNKESPRPEWLNNKT